MWYLVEVVQYDDQTNQLESTTVYVEADSFFDALHTAMPHVKLGKKVDYISVTANKTDGIFVPQQKSAARSK